MKDYWRDRPSSGELGAFGDKPAIRNELHRQKMNETLTLFSLPGKRALITGSGRAIALTLARGLAAPARQSSSTIAMSSARRALARPARSEPRGDKRHA
jgi:hypothetical protein